MCVDHQFVGNHAKMVRTFIWEGLDIVWGERKQPVEVEMPELRRECIMGTFPIHYGTLFLK